MRIAQDLRRAVVEEIEHLTAFIRAAEHLLRDSSLENIDDSANFGPKTAVGTSEALESADNVIDFNKVSARGRGGRTA